MPPRPSPSLSTLLLVAALAGCSPPPSSEGDAGLAAPSDAQALAAPDAEAAGEGDAGGPDAVAAPDAAAEAGPDAGADPDAGAADPDAAQDLHFAILTDLHVGEDIHPAYSGEDYVATQRLAAAVERINAMAAAERLEYVFILGDLTGSAELKELQKARELLDGLAVPWFPLLGNHDVWTYTDDVEAPGPTADATFVALFEDRFAGVEHDFAEVWNPEESTWSRFIDFEIRHGEVVLLGLDWNTRKHALPTFEGARPDADLHDFEGGTLRWLKARLAALPATTRTVIFLQHHGFRTAPPIPAAAFTFSSAEGAAFRGALEAAPPLSRYFGVLAGHSHRDYHGTAFDEWPWFEQHELAATKETGELALVHVLADGTVTVEAGR